MSQTQSRGRQLKNQDEDIDHLFRELLLKSMASSELSPAQLGPLGHQAESYTSASKRVQALTHLDICSFPTHSLSTYWALLSHNYCQHSQIHHNILNPKQAPPDIISGLATRQTPFFLHGSLGLISRAGEEHACTPTGLTVRSSGLG